MNTKIYITIAVTELILILIYYLIVWYKFGKNPIIANIYPGGDIPKELSPAIIRYVLNSKYDEKTFMVAIISLATKGLIKIIEIETDIKSDNFNEKSFILKKLSANGKEMSKDEKLIYHKIFILKDEIELNSDNSKLIWRTQSAHRDEITKNSDNKYFVSNKKWCDIGFGISILAASISLLNSSIFESETIVTMLLFFGINIQLGKYFALLLKDNIYERRNNILTIIGACLFFYLPNSFIIFSFEYFNYFTSTEITLFLSYGFIHGIFSRSMKKSTAKRIEIVKIIKSLSLFLGNIEKYNTKSLETLPLAQKCFDKYLPYTMALDLNDQWSTQFKIKNSNMGQPLCPSWFSGIDWNNYTNLDNSPSFGDHFLSSLDYTSISSDNSINDDGLSDFGGD